MPFVTVYLWPCGNEMKERVIRGITKVFTDEGIPEAAVQVVIQDVPKECWGIGGQPASKKFPA